METAPEFVAASVSFKSSSLNGYSISSVASGRSLFKDFSNVLSTGSLLLSPGVSSERGEGVTEFNLLYSVRGMYNVPEDSSRCPRCCNSTSSIFYFTTFFLVLHTLSAFQPRCPSYDSTLTVIRVLVFKTNLLQLRLTSFTLHQGGRDPLVAFAWSIEELMGILFVWRWAAAE